MSMEMDERDTSLAQLVECLESPEAARYLHWTHRDLCRHAADQDRAMASLAARHKAAGEALMNAKLRVLELEALMETPEQQWEINRQLDDPEADAVQPEHQRTRPEPAPMGLPRLRSRARVPRRRIRWEPWVVLALGVAAWYSAAKFLWLIDGLVWR